MTIPVPGAPGEQAPTRHFVAVDPTAGRILMLWTLTGYSAGPHPPALPEGAEAVELPEERANEVREQLEAGRRFWWDPGAREIREAAPFEPLGLPEESELVGTREIFRVAEPAPTSITLDWRGPEAVLLRFAGEEVLAARPFLVELPEPGDYEFEVIDPRFIEGGFILSVEEPAVE